MRCPYACSVCVLRWLCTVYSLYLGSRDSWYSLTEIDRISSEKDRALEPISPSGNPCLPASLQHASSADEMCGWGAVSCTQLRLWRWAWHKRHAEVRVRGLGKPAEPCRGPRAGTSANRSSERLDVNSEPLWVMRFPQISPLGTYMSHLFREHSSWPLHA